MLNLKWRSLRTVPEGMRRGTPTGMRIIMANPLALELSRESVARVA
jgi:hypothetical protein